MSLQVDWGKNPYRIVDLSGSRGTVGVFYCGSLFVWLLGGFLFCVLGGEVIRDGYWILDARRWSSFKFYDLVLELWWLSTP
jgi:hypothetical protein